MNTSKKHLNTVLLKQDMRMSQQPYEALKKQISYSNYFNPQFNQKQSTQKLQIKDALLEVQKFIKGNKNIDAQKVKHIQKIHLTPMINNNFMCSFNQNQYSLYPEDKVKIVKEKVFKVQNYYNYLYELQTNKKINQVNEKVNQLIDINQKNRKLDNELLYESVKKENKDINKNSRYQSANINPNNLETYKKNIQQQRDLFTSVLRQNQKSQIQQRFSFSHLNK